MKMRDKPAEQLGYKRLAAQLIRDLLTSGYADWLSEDFKRSSWDEVSRLEGEVNEIETKKYWSERAEWRRGEER